MSEEEQEKLLKKKKEHRKAIVAKSQRKRREAARRIGMCRICCKNEAAPGRRCCEKCLERSRMTMARKRQVKTLYKGCDNCRWYAMSGKELEQEPCEDAVSRQAAINAAIDGADKWDGGFNREREKCIREEIEKLPPVTPQPCEDCISREAVMHILDEVGGDFDSPREAVIPIDYIADMVSELPPVTPQPKMGRWIKDKCSVCGEERAWYGLNPPYCPDCGCKMQEVEND